MALTTIQRAFRTNRPGRWRNGSPFRGEGELLTFLFHGVFADRGDVDSRWVDPQQAITLDDLRRFVEYFLECSYRFVGPDDVEAGLSPGRYVMATFDDGYFNNSLVQLVLDEFGVPAVFFISTNHVKEHKCYWWDVVHRELIKRGATVAEISAEKGRLKQKTNREIEDHLVSTFGAKALAPLGPIDRPFWPNELAGFSRQCFVHLGNHTCDHAILTNYSYHEALAQIGTAQRDLQEMCGVTPRAISYPNGNHSPAVLRAAEEAGLSLGITVQKRRNMLPHDLSGDRRLRLGRFTLWGTADIASQCAHYRTYGPWRTRLVGWLGRRHAA